MTATLSAAFALLSVATFLLARLWSENTRLVQSRRRTCALLRRVKRQRDEAAADFVSAIETAVDMQKELDRLEMRVRKVVPIRGGWAN